MSIIITILIIIQTNSNTHTHTSATLIWTIFLILTIHLISYSPFYPMVRCSWFGFFFRFFPPILITSEKKTLFSFHLGIGTGDGIACVFSFVFGCLWDNRVCLVGWLMLMLDVLFINLHFIIILFSEKKEQHHLLKHHHHLFFFVIISFFFTFFSKVCFCFVFWFGFSRWCFSSAASYSLPGLGNGESFLRECSHADGWINV